MKTLIYHVGLCLAIALLLCLAPMPYGYYTLVRFAAMVIFCCMAISLYKEDKIHLSIIALSLSLLFQPFLKIALGRTMWNVVDVIVASALIILWFKNNRR